MKRWSNGKTVPLSLEPSSRRDHNNKEVFIITHKSASPNLINLQTCSWIQVLMLIMSNDTSEIKRQWIGRICNTRLILTHAEPAGKVPHSSCRLNPSTVPLTKSPIFKSPHCRFSTLTWIYKKKLRYITCILCCWPDKPYSPRLTFWQWGAGTKCPRRTLESLLPSLGTWQKIRMFTRTFFDAIGIHERNGQNSFTFLFIWILPVLLLAKLEKRHCSCNLVTPQWSNSMWQTTHTARTHAQIKFINSYLPVKKIMLAFSILKTHPSITCQRRNVHLDHSAGIRIRAERSDVWCMSN